jgi:peptide/nickel transport system substrate-binding protein
MAPRPSTPFRTRPLSRRRFVAGASATLAGGVVASACAGSSGRSNRQPNPNETPQPGGELRTAFFFDFDNLDPVQGGFAFPVFQRLYSYLHHIDGRTLEVIPDISIAYEQPDDVTYIFKLRSGVRFHDLAPANGRELTADDVVYSFNRLNTVLNPIDPGFMSRIVDRIEALDPYTVRITNKRPYASTMQVLGGYWYAIVAQEAVEAWGGLSTRALGSGPFTLESFEQESGASLRRNPNYFRTGRPYLERMELPVVSDPTNLLTQFRTRALDVNTAPLDGPRWEALKRELDGVQSARTPGILDPWIGVNLRRAPFNDIRARQALDLLIDRRDMIEKLAFGDGKLNGPIPWGNERWALPQDELEAIYRTDVDEARMLLDAAGVEKRTIMHRVTPALPLGEEIGTMLKEQLRPAGFDVTIDVREQNDWIQTVILEHDFDTCGFAWFPVLDPTVSLRFVDRNDLFSGFMFGFDDPHIGSLYDAVQLQFDFGARREAMWALQRAVLDYHGPVLHTFDSYQYALWWPWVRNWDASNMELNFYSAEHWVSSS